MLKGRLWYNSVVQGLERKRLISTLNMDKKRKQTGGTRQNPRHSTVEFLLRRMRHSRNFPSISKYITEINKKLSSTEKYTSTSDLANAVLKDYALTTKLLRLVNSAFHGTLTKPVNTISRAIVLLGFEQVRMAATSIIFFEHLKGKDNVKELKDSAVSSFTSAILARNLAEKFSVDPEEVYICALFQNMGKHLAIFHLPDEYEEIKRTMARKGIDERVASRMVLGRTFGELGVEIADAWEFSNRIRNGMKLLPGGDVGKAGSEDDILQGISNYANEICAIIGGTQGNERVQALESSRKRFSKCIPVSKNQFQELLDSSRDEIGKYSEILEIDIKDSSFIRALTSEPEDCDETHLDSNTVPTVREKGQEVAPGTELAPEGRTVALDDLYKDESRTILMNGVQEITNTLVEDFRLDDLILMILETMFRGFRFNCVIFCMMEQKRRRVQARFGLGRDIDAMIKNFGFKIEKSQDLFNIAVSETRDFLIDDSNDPDIKAKVPRWYRKTVNAPSFMVYPIFIDKVCLGLFYADKENEGPPIPETQLSFMKTLRNQLILAIKQSRL